MGTDAVDNKRASIKENTMSEILIEPDDAGVKITMPDGHVFRNCYPIKCSYHTSDDPSAVNVSFQYSKPTKRSGPDEEIDKTIAWLYEKKIENPIRAIRFLKRAFGGADPEMLKKRFFEQRPVKASDREINDRIAELYRRHAAHSDAVEDLCTRYPERSREELEKMYAALMPF